jgi:lipopolysaccharide transport system ATP-binding protein
MKPVISVSDLGKMYRIQHKPRYNALRDVIASGVTAPFRFAGRTLAAARSGEQRSVRSTDEEFWALKDVSFNVGAGEVVGIVGRNGAGKSTLLKLLSQITEPTEGRINLRGRVASLLEVGTGFHPELTGRENIFLNGAILGMSRREVKARFDEIVAFAEVERFLDTPVKRYSSGMYVRLAFAIAAHLEPEILVVDEVLAVGDAQFQKKCLGRMDAVAHSGRTVLFVSHSMATIQRLCNRGIFLERGRLLDDGPIGQIVARYNSMGQRLDEIAFNDRERSGAGWARVTDLRIVPQNGYSTSPSSDEDLVIDVDIALTESAEQGMSLRGLVIELQFFNEQGQPLTTVMNVDEPGLELPEETSCTVRMRLPGPTFVQGTYSVNTCLGIPFVQHVDEIREALVFEVMPPGNAWRPYDLYQMRGSMCRKAEWSRVERSVLTDPDDAPQLELREAQS